MCGIAGLIDRRGQPVSRAVLELMCQALIHRGPDSDGFLIDGWAGLAMRRLQVIDLVTGDQPIATADGRYQIVLNGEIYNYRELREQLLAAGHVFRTATDTEVVLHLFQEHGSAMLGRLNGMYALAIWDRDRQELFLARDRVGIKPLYYVDTPGLLLFASEISALHASGLVAREIEPGLLPTLLTLQYVPGPETLFRGVRRLPPGSYLRADQQGSELCCWSAPTPTEGRTRLSVAEARQELRSTLRSAVASRMIADVPLGAFLSGGIDSSIVVGLMAAESSRPVKTFSVGFATAAAFDELAQARLVARHFATDHHELVFSSADLVDSFATVLDHLDDPIVDPAVLPTYLLAGLARQQVTVALSGEGADELLGGYRRYRLQHAARWLPPWVFGLVPPIGGHRVRQAVAALRCRDPLQNHLAWCQAISDSVAGRLLAPDLLAEARRHVNERLSAHLPEGCDRVTAAMQIDQHTWLVDDLLTKVDRMTMAQSLEARVPYLDWRMVELANRLPLAMKIRGLTGKVILREAFADLLPAPILRRAKQGFDLPLSEWFRTSLRSYVFDQLAGLRGDPLLADGAVDWVLDEHMSGRDAYPLLIFALLVYRHL